MSTEIKTEASKVEMFFQKVKQYLNNGIPDVHLSKGCIGELAILAEHEHNRGSFYAIIYIWQPEFNDFAQLREVFKRYGAKYISIHQTLDDEDNYIVGGIDQGTNARQISVEFRA